MGYQVLRSNIAVQDPHKEVVLNDGTTMASFNKDSSDVGGGVQFSFESGVESAIRVNPHGTSAGQTGEVRLAELVANGTNYTGFKPPDSLAANLIYRLPSTQGTNGQALLNDGSGNLTWTTVLTATGVELYSGSGSPEGAQSAATGSLYVDTADGSVYTKTSGTGNTGWSKLALEQNLGALTTENVNSQVDNWNPTDLARGTVLVNNTGNNFLTGVVAQSNGFQLRIVNVGSGTLTFKKENTSSAVANRLASGADKPMGPGEAAQFVYSTDMSRWIAFV